MPSTEFGMTEAVEQWRHHFEDLAPPAGLSPLAVMIWALRVDGRWQHDNPELSQIIYEWQACHSVGELKHPRIAFYETLEDLGLIDLEYCTAEEMHQALCGLASQLHRHWRVHGYPRNWMATYTNFVLRACGTAEQQRIDAYLELDDLPPAAG